MARRGERHLLFLGSGTPEHNRLAEQSFNAVAVRMGLPWRATARSLDGAAPVSADDLKGAERIVALVAAEHLPLLHERIPTSADKVELWHIAATAEAPAQIEREVMALVARLLGGGTRPEPVAEPAPPRATPKPAATVRVGRETKGRRGKGVTTVSDVPLDADGLRDLAAQIKQRCGTGGTVKDGRIEIQGDQRDRLIAALEQMGYKVKRVGG